MTLLPLIEVIRHHDDPDEELPAHRTDQRLPLTLATAVTLAPADRLRSVRAVVVGFVRSLTPSQRAASEVAPIAGVGAIATAASEHHQRGQAGGSERQQPAASCRPVGSVDGGRVGEDQEDLQGAMAQASTTDAGPAMAPWGQFRTAQW